MLGDQWYHFGTSFVLLLFKVCQMQVPIHFMSLLAVEVQDVLQESCTTANEQPARKKRKAPVCRKCNKPMKNHSRDSCVGSSDT